MGVTRRRKARQENEFTPAAFECRLLLDGTTPTVGPPVIVVPANPNQLTPTPFLTSQAPAVSSAQAPVAPPTQVATVTPFQVPIVTPAQVPVVPPFQAPVVTPFQVPVVPSAQAPVVPPAQAPVGRGRPLEHRLFEANSTIVERRNYAIWNPGANTYEEIASFQKTTTRSETFEFVDPVEHAAAQHLRDVSQASLTLLKAEVKRLEDALRDFVPLWNLVQVGLVGGLVVGSWAGSDMLDSTRTTLANKKATMMLEETNFARLQNQVFTGAGLTRRVETIPKLPEISTWDVSNGFIPTSVWAPWCVAHGLGNNPPNQFWIDDAPVTYTSRDMMPDWVKNLYDQSNPGGGLW